MNLTPQQSSERSQSRPLEIPGEMSSKRSAINEAIRQTIHRERSRAKAIADAIGCSLKRIYKIGDPTDVTEMRAAELEGLVRATGDFAALDTIEARVGRIAFRLPPVNPHVEEMNREFARTVRQFGEFVETNGDVLADGLIEPHEVPGLLGALDSMIAMASEYRACVLEKARRDAAAA